MKSLKNSLVCDLKLPVGYNTYRIIFVDLEFQVGRTTNHLRIAIERGLEKHEAIKKQNHKY